MPDLLIFTPDAALNSTIEQIGVEAGFRVRSCVGLRKALHWLAVREFDVAVVHASISLTDQQEVAHLLWQRNLNALYYVLDLGARKSGVSEMRLYGAEILRGHNALARLGEALKRRAEVKIEYGGDFRILVVEDLPSPRDIICIFVESLGYAGVTGVGSAPEALQLLEADPDRYDCLITDVRMPEMSGKELIEALRSDPHRSHLPIVVLTAFGTTDCLLDCLRAGASGFLAKPPKKPDLQRELGRAERIYRQRLDPRLVPEGEFELFREMLEEKGLL